MSMNPPLRDWRNKRVWLIGASTGIGRALAEQLHAQGAQVIVSARNHDALEEFVRHHSGSLALQLDITDGEAIRSATDLATKDGAIDLVCYCAGHYKPMRADNIDLAELLKHHEINTIGALKVLDAVIPNMLTRKQGHISLISSVAGFRGLPQSLAYGPTKAALINLAETLYLDLHPQGLGVSLINPGFVRTPLTAQNDFHMPALISPEDAAKAILKGWSHGDFEIHFPKRFTRFMKLLRLLPYPIYFAVVRRITGL